MIRTYILVLTLHYMLNTYIIHYTIYRVVRYKYTAGEGRHGRGQDPLLASSVVERGKSASGSPPYPIPRVEDARQPRPFFW